MSAESYWCHVQNLCQRLFLKHGQNITVPLEPDPNGPLKVFDDVDVSATPFRFVAYIMWLRYQPQSFEWFCKLLETRRELVDDCLCSLTTALVS